MTSDRARSGDTPGAILAALPAEPPEEGEPFEKILGDIDRELRPVRLKGGRHGGRLGEPKMQAHLREALIERLKLHTLRLADEGNPFGNDRTEAPLGGFARPLKTALGATCLSPGHLSSGDCGRCRPRR